MAEAYVPQDLSLAKLVLYHVLIFDKSCEKRGTVYLFSLQYYDFILQNLTRKTAEIAFAGIYISKFSGGARPRTPLECLAPSALPQNNHPGYDTDRMADAGWQDLLNLTQFGRAGVSFKS